MKIPVDFDVDFDTKEVAPIPLGRLYVGNSHTVRVIFGHDGQTRLLIPQEAIDDGSILVGERQPQVSLAGFRKPTS